MPEDFYETVRDQLDTSVYQAAAGLSFNVTHKHTPVENTNDRGEADGVSFTEDTIRVVGWNAASYRRGIEMFGEPNVGDLDIAVDHSVTISSDDHFVVKGEEYVVDEIGPNWLNENVTTIVRLTKA